MDCYACANPAINACKRCSNSYCEDHGNATYCANCLRPASAVPSSNLYFGALLLMLIGTALAVYLIIRPPGETSDAASVAVGRATAAPTVAGGGSEPTAAATPRPSPTASAPSPTVAPTESPYITYVVQEGDTLFSIAENNLPPGDDVIAYLNAIANLNGIDPDNPNLQIGDEIQLPPRPE